MQIIPLVDLVTFFFYFTLSLLCISSFESTHKVFKVHRIQTMALELSFSLWPSGQLDIGTILFIEITSILPWVSQKRQHACVPPWHNNAAASFPVFWNSLLWTLSPHVSHLIILNERLPAESLGLHGRLLRCQTFEGSHLGPSTKPRHNVDMPEWLQ